MLMFYFTIVKNITSLSLLVGTAVVSIILTQATRLESVVALCPGKCLAEVFPGEFCVFG